jgi:hypothetical protein
MEMITLRRFNAYHIIALTMLIIIVGFFTVSYAYETQSNNKGQVTINVRPLQLVPGQPAKFEVRMNTHSVTLDHDLVTAFTLKDDQGREYQPTQWDGSPPGGHHRKGILEFPELNGDAGKITLVIREISNVPNRTFEWSVEQ